MGIKSLHLVILLVWAAMLSGCNSSSNPVTTLSPDTPTDGTNAPVNDNSSGNDPVDDAPQENDADSGANDSGSGGTDTDENNSGESDGGGDFGLPTDDEESITINDPPVLPGNPDDTDGDTNTATSYCAQISTDINYELFYGQCQCGRDYARYVPSGYPGIYGWDGNNYCDLTGSTNVEEISLLVPYSATPPAIDGISTPYPLDWRTAAGASWSSEKRHMLLTQNLLTDNGNGYQDGARASDFLIMHDMEYLYIHVLPRNEGGQVYLDSNEPSEDDSIEIFIDGNNSKGTSYDGVDDFHTIIAYLDSSRTPEAGPNSAPGLQIEFDTDEDNRPEVGAWVVYEVKINLESAGITIGKPFGLEVQLNEDDNGGPVDATFGWSEPFASNVADSNPSVFGTVVLTSCEDLNNCDMSQSLIGE